MPYRQPPPVEIMRPLDDPAQAYARACGRHRRRAVATAIVFFVAVVIAVFVLPAMAPPHHPTMQSSY